MALQGSGGAKRDKRQHQVYGKDRVENQAVHGVQLQRDEDRVQYADEGHDDRVGGPAHQLLDDAGNVVLPFLVSTHVLLADHLLLHAVRLHVHLRVEVRQVPEADVLVQDDDLEQRETHEVDHIDPVHQRRADHLPHLGEEPEEHPHPIAHQQDERALADQGHGRVRPASQSQLGLVQAPVSVVTILLAGYGRIQGCIQILYTILFSQSAGAAG
mmetsp:Transcript_46081/g.82286  ORF Transcript_46081/g.82286 Transcript_46081/m.82286 type:complete len:214 (-) Transcript_46081:735-1376(-)